MDTSRIVPTVRIVTCDLALLDAATGDHVALGRALDCEVAEGWDVFPGALSRVRETLAADPLRGRWGTRFFLVEQPRTLVGWGGFKGAPQDGAVELGYAIAPAWEGRGVATAAVRELVLQAWAAPEVHVVLAHTLPGPGASVRVLEKNGFAFDGESLDGDAGGVWRFTLARASA